MKRRTFFAVFGFVLMTSFFKGVFIPVNNGITAVKGVFVIIVGAIAIERIVMFLQKKYKDKKDINA